MYMYTICAVIEHMYIVWNGDGMWRRDEAESGSPT